MALDREDGELEDGELDDDDDVDAMPTLPPALGKPNEDHSSHDNFHKSPPVLSAQGDVDYRTPDVDYRNTGNFGSSGDLNAEQSNYNQEEGEFEDRRGTRHGSVSGDSGASDDDGKRRRHDKRHNKKDKRKRKHEDRRKKKKKYHDFDSAGDQRGSEYKSADDPYMGGWPGYGGNKRERGSYDSPGSRDGSPDYYDRDHKQDPRARGSPRPYGSPYNSPPGPYDSPDEDSYTDGRRKSKYPRFNNPSSHEPSSLLSMVGDDYFDANVAANEKEELFDRSNKSGQNQKSRKKIEKSKKYRELQKQRDKEYEERKQKRESERKRQPCRFYQDGHCPRGDDCDYSHEGPKRELSSKKVLCKHYMRGGCNRDWCVFMHGDYPCKYYFQNRCEMGDRCRFTHSELDDETKLILDRDEREVSPKRKGQVRKPGQDKPSLLGKQSTTTQSSSSHGRRDHNNCEPPKYVQETMKKIPSLFDIKVEKPKGPTNLPHMGGPNAMSPNQRPPVRPGFYSDMMGTPPRMGGHGGAGLLGPGPRPPAPMQGMNIPPPGFLGPPPGPPPFMGGGNFFGPMAPPRPPIMGGMGMNDGNEGALENKENAMDGGVHNDDWNNQEQDGWFGNEDGPNEKNPPTQPGQQKIDISAMLTMIRNNMVGGASSSPQQNTSQPAAPAVRDPRSSIGNDPRASRQDPRASNRDTESRNKPPVSESPAEPQTEATFGFAQNQMKSESEKMREENEKVINCSLSYTGGMPYFLYKITVDVLRPMLPKTVDPNNEKFADDPRVKRYGRIGQPVPDVEPKMIRPHSRHSSSDSVSDLRTKVPDPKMATPPKPKSEPAATLGAFGALEPPKLDDTKAVSLPEGLKKPLIPLPKLLDPRLGRQLSMEVDKKVEKGNQQKSPPASGKGGQPFSHRNDPRFKKKSKGRSNSTGESENLEHQNSSDHNDSLGSDVSADKSLEPDAKILTVKEEVEKEEEKNEKLENMLDGENCEITDEAPKSGRRDNPMAYATPLGYYSEVRDESYNSYNKLLQENNKDSLNTSDSNFQGNREPEETETQPVSTYGESMTSHMGAVYTPAEEVPSYVPIKDMFKTIDPTASPFGSIS